MRWRLLRLSRESLRPHPGIGHGGQTLLRSDGRARSRRPADRHQPRRSRRAPTERSCPGRTGLSSRRRTSTVTSRRSHRWTRTPTTCLSSRRCWLADRRSCRARPARSPRCPTRHAHRPWHGQDPSLPASCRRADRRLSRWRLLRRAGPDQRPVLVVPTIACSVGPRTLAAVRPSTRSSTTCATSASCWCWTLSSRSWRRSVVADLLSRGRPQGARHEPLCSACAASTSPAPPLGLPDAGRRSLAQELASYPAIALFSQRNKVRPGFSLTAENALGRLRHLSAPGWPPAGDRACRRARQAAGSSGDARPTGAPPPAVDWRRPRFARAPATLRDTIAWSYDLLDEPRTSALPPPRRLRRRAAR